MVDIIAGLKLIRHTGQPDIPDDPSYPWKVVVNLSPPEFMKVGWAAIFGGSEEVIVRGMTRNAIDEFIARNDFEHHPRLRSITVSQNGETR